MSQPSPPPHSYFHQNNSSFYLSCLSRFHLQTSLLRKKKKLQTTVLRFDPRPTSTGSILAFQSIFVLELASQTQAQAFAYSHTQTYKYTHVINMQTFDGFVAHTPTEALAWV